MAAGLLSSLFLSLSPLSPQAPQEPAAAVVVARCTLAGKPAVITRGDVALEMAFHQRRREEGKAACEHIVDSLLVELEAKSRHITADDTEARAEWAELQRQYRAAGHNPNLEPVVKNSTEAELLAYLATPVLLRKLVRSELALKPQENVSSEMMRLWLQEARKRHPVVDDPDQLPLGTAVRVGDQTVPLLDLGLLLLRTSSDEQRDHFIRQVVLLQGIEALARADEITVSRRELEQEVERRRALAAADPRYHGLSYEQLLQSQGTTVASLLESRVFRSLLLQRKIAEHRHPPESLLRELQQDRQAVLDRCGPRRRLAVIFVRALDPPNALVPRSFADAMQHLAEVKQRLEKDAFDVVARIESDDPGSKVRGGDLGWFQRLAKNLPEQALAAAFALPAGGVSEPIRGADGGYLVKVLEIEPDLADQQLLDRLRDDYATELPAQVLEQADLRRADGSPFDGEPAAATAAPAAPPAKEPGRER
jgi:hypothetical protein